MAISSPGLASGLDIKSIVSQLVALERAPLAPLQQKAAGLQSKLSIYGTIKSMVSALGDAAKKLADPKAWDLVKGGSTAPDRVGISVAAGTPPTSMSIEVQALARAQLALGLSERQQDLQQLPRLKSELERLEAMLDELLTYSKLDAGQYQLQYHPVDLVALTEQVLDINQLEADAKQQHFRFQAPAQVWLLADSHLLGRAIENIVRNALKYAPTNSHIDCTITVQAQQLLLTVRDYGPGIAQAQLSDIFQPFYRVSDSRNSQTGGTGLGLAIVAQIIRQHHGQVSASLPAGGGLQINVTLPLPPPNQMLDPDD